MSLSNFFSLVYNELFKTYIRKSTWIMYIILIVLIGSSGLITRTFDTSSSNTIGAAQFASQNYVFLSIVSLLAIIVAAGIVAHEFRWGTIKLLLIRPISRTKILLSKYVSVILFALITSIFVLIFAWLVGLVFFGFGELNPQMTVYTNMG